MSKTDRGVKEVHAVGSQVDLVLGQLPERAEIERLAKWLDDAAFSDAATSFHEYEQASKALRGLQAALDAAVAAERERCAKLQQVWEDTRTQRDELLAHLTRKEPLPAWAVEWIRVYGA